MIFERKKEDNKHLHKIDSIASGAFGKVGLYENNFGRKFAIKIAKKDPKGLLNEYKILKYLKKKNICSNFLCIHGKIPDETRPAIVVDYLKNYVTLTNKLILSLPTIDRKKIAHTVIDRVELLHKNKVVHSDIKPQNILVNPITLDVRLLDFGGATIITSSKTLYHPRHYTRAYFAKCREKNSYTALEMMQNDNWALGLTLLKLLLVRSKRRLERISTHNYQRANRYLHRKLKIKKNFFEC
jgi:serine/threonine protein kinase